MVYFTYFCKTTIKGQLYWLKYFSSVKFRVTSFLLAVKYLCEDFFTSVVIVITSGTNYK